MIGESMEGTYMWSQAAPVFIGMDAYMTAMAEPYKLMQGIISSLSWLEFDIVQYSVEYFINFALLK